MKFIKEKNINSKFSVFNSTNAFSFVELLVGITISMLLMFSVSVFIQNGMKSIVNQRKSLSNNYKIKEFSKILYDNIFLIDNNFPLKEINSGILFKINKNFGKGGFAFFGEKEFDGVYCKTGTNTKTNNLIIKNFIPFEGKGGDIFDSKSFSDGGNSTNMFAGLVNNKSSILLGPTDFIKLNNNKKYVSDTLGNSIYEFRNSDLSDLKKIVGKDIFGDEFSEGRNGTGIYLNNPTGLAYGTISGKKYLFLSDTLNDRILYLDLQDYKIHKLLGREEGLKEPTGLYYDEIENILYISNSGKSEILSYSSSGSFQNFLNINFKPKKDFSANKIVFSFFHESRVNPSITGPTDTGSFDFGIVQNIDFLTGTDNKLSYYFSNYSNKVNNNFPCNFNKYYLNSDIPYKIKDCNGLTGTLWKGNVFKDFNSSTNYNFKINNLTGSNLDENGNYYLELSFFKNGVLKYSDYLPFFKKGDNNLFTKDDNTLKVLAFGLGYPTGIYKDGGNLVFNDFLKRKKYKIENNGNVLENGNLTDFDFDKLSLNTGIDSFLISPIRNSNLNISNGFINIYFDYYTNYICEAKDGLTKQYIIKQNIK